MINFEICFKKISTSMCPQSGKVRCITNFTKVELRLGVSIHS